MTIAKKAVAVFDVTTNVAYSVFKKILLLAVVVAFFTSLFVIGIVTGIQALMH